MKKKSLKLMSIASIFVLTIGLFAGCGSKDRSKEINILNYGENIAEGVKKEFQKQTGIKVNEKTFDDMQYMYTEVSTGKVDYDVILVNDDMAEKMISEGLLQTLNKDNIPNLVNMNDQDMGKPYDPNNDYTVPYMNGTVGLIYNTELVDAPIDSWTALFDEKYKNEIFMFDNMRDTLGVALKTLGYSLNSTNPDELNAAKELLIKQKELNAIYGADEVLDLMRTGEKTVAMIWSGEGLNLEAEDSKFKYIIPKEGCDLWLDSWAIPKNAGNVYGAEMFMNFVSSGDIALRTADEIGYTTPQREAMEAQETEVKDNPNAYMPEDIFKLCEVYKSLTGKNLELYQNTWNELRIGSSEVEENTNTISPVLIIAISVVLIGGISMIVIKRKKK